jgi:hypothetical protein
MTNNDELLETIQEHMREIKRGNREGILLNLFYNYFYIFHIFKMKVKILKFRFIQLLKWIPQIQNFLLGNEVLVILLNNNI